MTGRDERVRRLIGDRFHVETAQVIGRAHYSHVRLAATQRLSLVWAAHAAGDDPRSAVLFAAIASETHAKTVLLRELERRGEGLLGKPMLRKALPSRAVELYGALSSAVIGRSLKEEMPDVYRNLARLFERRTTVAHTGSLSPTDSSRGLSEVGVESVRAAIQATRWLTSAVSLSIKDHQSERGSSS